MEACRKVCVPRVPSCSPPRRCPHRTTCPPTDLGSRNAVPPLIRSALILTHATHRPTVCTLTCACFFSSSGLWLHHGNVRLPSSQRTAAPIALAPPGGSRSHLRAQRAVPQAGLCVQHQHRQCPIRPASGCVRKRCSRGGPGLDCTRPRTHSLAPCAPACSLGHQGVESSRAPSPKSSASSAREKRSCATPSA